MVGTPEFPIKGTDRFAIMTASYYRRLCMAHGLREQADEVLAAIEEMAAWQAANRDSVHLPDHKHVPLGRADANEKADMLALRVEPTDTTLRNGFATWADAIDRLMRMPNMLITPQQMADMLRNLSSQESEQPVPKDERPHSRACGYKAHPHGPECSANCPTCAGTKRATMEPGVTYEVVFATPAEAGMGYLRDYRRERLGEWPIVGEPLTGDIPPNE